ncbi:uncharacterized protein A1O9_01887 [Exophiala aquamarina CBS 119918]|uniref:Hydrophobin n=1 Tax=Exophiala aquamarina CBS 119918 TaxID=1182545 RepID=A0A072PKS3_9EURO|nr:uncharacterized protein A1O9_01887 [Exophiala aquamarina CBS 119918]KEF60327.1 hypothetical protein A1O9_01887 [Exophiala aquamarina CBS 119918]
MRFQSIAIALAGATTAMAAAVPGKSTLLDRQAALCSGASSSPVCCATDVLGVADLDCAPPPETPTDVDNFGEICAAIGQRARCCLLPIVSGTLQAGIVDQRKANNTNQQLEQGLICSAPA